MLPDSCGSPRSHKHPKEQSQSPVQSPRRLASPRTPLQPGHGCAVPPRHCSPQPRLPCCSPLPAISPSPACRVRGTPELGCLGGCITQPGIGCAAPMALLIAEHPAPKSTALGWWGRGLGGQGGSACCLWAAKGTGASCIALVPRQPPLLALRLLQVGAPLFPRIASARAMPWHCWARNNCCLPASPPGTAPRGRCTGGPRPPRPQLAPRGSHPRLPTLPVPLPAPSQCLSPCQALGGGFVPSQSCH